MAEVQAEIVRKIEADESHTEQDLLAAVAWLNELKTRARYVM